MSDDSQSLEHWLVAPHATGKPRSHEIGFVRQLDEQERERIMAADRLITRMANSASYQRCVSVLQVLQALIGELGKQERPNTSLLDGLRTATGSLAESLRLLADDLDQDAPAELTAAIQAVQDGSAWRQVALITEGAGGALHRHRNGTIVWRQADTGGMIDVAAAARTAVLQGQQLIARRFLALESELRAAAGLLRQLAVETLEGPPTIFSVPTTMLEAGQPGQVTPHQLALEKIDAVLGSARLARQHLEPKQPETAGTPAGEDATETVDAAAGDTAASGSAAPAGSAAGEGGSTESEPEGGERTGPAHEADGQERARTPPDPVTVEDPGTAHRPRDDEDPAAPTNGTNVGAAIEPVLLQPVFQQARNLQQALEHAWSRSLDETLLEPALAEQLAAIHSLLRSLTTRIEDEDRRLRTAGVDPRIPGWPPTPEMLAALDPCQRPDSTGRSKDLRLAQITALQAVTETLAAFREPSTVQFTVGQDGQRMDRFWDAGAFALLRTRIELLERLTREHERWLAQHEQAEPRVPESDPGATLDRLFLGARALGHGDPEAALLHATAALAARYASSPDGPLAAIRQEALGSDHIPVEAPEMLERAFTVTARLSEGRENLAVATLLAQETLALAHSLLVGPLPDRQASTKELAEMFEAGMPDSEPLQTDEGENG
jgi:hypothetical protein